MPASGRAAPKPRPVNTLEKVQAEVTDDSQSLEGLHSDKRLKLLLEEAERFTSANTKRRTGTKNAKKLTNESGSDTCTSALTSHTSATRQAPAKRSVPSKSSAPAKCTAPAERPALRNGFDGSRLALLPSELRNRIYDYAFGNGFLFPTARGRWSRDMKLLQHPITLTCRQMREESLPLFYHKLTIGIYGKNEHTLPACQFFQTVGARQVSRMTIRITNAFAIQGNLVGDLLLVSKRRFNEIAAACVEADGEVKDVVEFGEAPWALNNSLSASSLRPHTHKICQTLLDLGVQVNAKLVTAGGTKRGGIAVGQLYGGIDAEPDMVGESTRRVRNVGDLHGVMTLANAAESEE